MGGHKAKYITLVGDPSEKVAARPNEADAETSSGVESFSESLEFGHESNSTSRPRSEDVVNLDYGKVGHRSLTPS